MHRIKQYLTAVWETVLMHLRFPLIFLCHATEKRMSFLDAIVSAAGTGMFLMEGVVAGLITIVVGAVIVVSITRLHSWLHHKRIIHDLYGFNANSKLVWRDYPRPGDKGYGMASMFGGMQMEEVNAEDLPPEVKQFFDDLVERQERAQAQRGDSPLGPDVPSNVTKH